MVGFEWGSCGDKEVWKMKCSVCDEEAKYFISVVKVLQEYDIDSNVVKGQECLDTLEYCYLCKDCYEKYKNYKLDIERFLA